MVKIVNLKHLHNLSAILVKRVHAESLYDFRKFFITSNDKPSFSMCGRFVFFELKDFIRQLHQYELPFVEEQEIDFSANYNIAPDTDIVVLLGDQSNENG